jgi:homocitrate synthase NifV
VLFAAFGKDESWLWSNLPEMVGRARARFRHVSVGAQDASRADPALVRKFVLLARDAGAYRVRIADTVGVWNPRQTWLCFRKLRRAAGERLCLEFHGHNDLGMATANTISAVEGGADAASVTVNGLGERAGNAPLEEVVMALLYTVGVDSGVHTAGIGPLCELVANRSGRSMHATKPITGRDVFRHESGIHTAALLKDPAAYQPMTTAEVGRAPESFAIGKHSGTAGVRAILTAGGITVPPTLYPELLAAVRRHARAKKCGLSAPELAAIAQQLIERKEIPAACRYPHVIN